MKEFGILLRGEAWGENRTRGILGAPARGVDLGIFASVIARASAIDGLPSAIDARIASTRERPESPVSRRCGGAKRRHCGLRHRFCRFPPAVTWRYSRPILLVERIREARIRAVTARNRAVHVLFRKSLKCLNQISSGLLTAGRRATSAKHFKSANRAHPTAVFRPPVSAGPLAAHGFSTCSSRRPTL